MSIYFNGYVEPEQKHSSYSIGTFVKFIMDGGQLKSVTQIPVQYA